MLNNDKAVQHGSSILGKLVKRLALLGVGGALWLVVAAVPVMADGGPHVMADNNGALGIQADGCATCHRVHTSKSATGYLLVSNETTITGYCRSCHGATATGASTDVDTGIQYALDGVTRNTGNVIGALRSGGFIKARIASDSAYRLVSNTGGVSSGKIPVANTPTPVTSAHIAIGGTGLTAKDVVWGNGALGTPNAGVTLNNEMECTACHNPHGNGNYRILNDLPNAGAPQANAAVAVKVTDAPWVQGKTRNYSVIQVAGTRGTDSTYLLYADQVLAARAAGTFNGIAGDYTSLSGDYFRKSVPFNGGTAYDGPNGQPNTSTNYTDTTGFNVQMTNWCAQCHTRYMAASGSRSTYSGDATFAYRHTTAKNRTCSTCHVAHGSNAAMQQYSASVPYPDNSVTVGNSRLLKTDSRGICQLCHDPTNGSAVVAPATSVGQGPTPVLLP